MTTVYVTHDQVEAITLGQRVCVMRDYANPVNLFVAGFIGAIRSGQAITLAVNTANLRFFDPDTGRAIG